MNNNFEKILTLQEMQDLFCDYVFNKLSDKDKQAFENSLSKYPDLIKELDDVKITFSWLEPQKLNNKFNDYTRNLSVKVKEKLSRQNRLNIRLQKLNKYLIPATGLAIILFMVSYFNIFDNNKKDHFSVIQTNNLFTGITQSDVDSLFINNQDTLFYFTEINKLIPASANQHSDFLAKLDETQFEKSISEVYDDILSEQILQDGINISNFGNLKQYDIYKNLDNLEEEDLDKILKELENADFNT